MEAVLRNQLPNGSLCYTSAIWPSSNTRIRSHMQMQEPMTLVLNKKAFRHAVGYSAWRQTRVQRTSQSDAAYQTGTKCQRGAICATAVPKVTMRCQTGGCHQAFIFYKYQMLQRCQTCHSGAICATAAPCVPMPCCMCHSGAKCANAKQCHICHSGAMCATAVLHVLQRCHMCATAVPHVCHSGAIFATVVPYVPQWCNMCHSGAIHAIAVPYVPQ
eukprot:1161775-Pelagomonas_calceolata.AAC.6